MAQNQLPPLSSSLKSCPPHPPHGGKLLSDCLSIVAALLFRPDKCQSLRPMTCRVWKFNRGSSQKIADFGRKLEQNANWCSSQGREP